ILPPPSEKGEAFLFVPPSLKPPRAVVPPVVVVPPPPASMGDNISGEHARNCCSNGDSHHSREGPHSYHPYRRWYHLHRLLHLQFAREASTVNRCPSTQEAT